VTQPKTENKMPAGVGWSRYLKFSASALLSMMAGSQVVHLYYRPLDDLEVYVETLEKELNVPKTV